MKTPNLLRSLLVLAAPLLLTACNESLTGTKTAPNVPVSFRIVGAKGTTLDSTELVQIRSYAGDASKRVRLDSLVRRWQDKEVALQVPLGEPLEFRFDGLNRRNDRLVAFWSALGFDTLRSGDRTANVVALQFTSNDVTPPSSTLLATPSSGYQVLPNPQGDTLFVSLPTGLSAGKLSLPASLDSVYLDGKNLPKDSVGWTFPVARGQDLPLTVVNPNGTSSNWVLAIRSGDIQGPSLLITLDNGATESVKSGETVFTLPYVIDSAITLKISNADAKDALKSLTFGKNTLDVGESSWTIPVKVPVAGDSIGIQYVLTAKDSLDNPTVQTVKIWRPKSVRIPSLTWLNPPGAEPTGAHTATYRIQVVGGDSLLPPVFLAPSLNSPATRLEATSQDTATWLCDILLGDKDAGEVTARIANLSGSAWTTAARMVTRWDSTTADATPPTLNLFAPANLAWITSGTATVVSGTAWDERGGKVTVLVGHSGRTDTATWLAKDSTWSWTLNWKEDGDSVLPLKAKDPSGNSTKDVVWTLRRDTRKPSLKWAGSMKIARDTFFTRAAQLPLEVLATEVGNGKMRSVTITRSGSSQLLQAVFDTITSVWKTTLDLGGLYGTSAWLATATDSAGNDSIKGFWVLRDTAKPVLTVTIPSPVGIDKFAVSAAKDTLWISGDTSLTVVVNAVSGHARIPLLGLLVDSSGVLNSTAKLQQSLTIQQVSGTSSLRRIAILDTLGNASDTTRLVVIGVAPISAPIVKFGNSLTPAKGRDSLPWPKTAHMTCPTGTTLNIGTSTSKDSVIWTTTNLSLSCNGPKIRSNVAGYTWTIQDTAYTDTTFKAPASDTAIALLVDSKDRNWLISQSGMQSYIYRFSRDSSYWITPSSAPGYFMSFNRIDALSGRGVNGSRFFARKSADDNMTDFYTPEPEQPGNISIASLTPTSTIRNDTILSGLICHYQNACIVRHALNGQLIGDTLIENGNGSRFIGAHSLKDHDLISVLRSPGSGSSEKEPNHAIFRVSSSEFSTVAFLGAALSDSTSGTTIASSIDDNRFYTLGKGKDGALWIQQRNSPLSTTAQSFGSVIPITVPAPGNLQAIRGTDALWLNIAGQGVYRFTEDLASYQSWPIRNAIGKPQADSWGGAWILVKTTKGYSTMHIKGLRQ